MFSVIPIVQASLVLELDGVMCQMSTKYFEIILLVSKSATKSC